MGGLMGAAALRQQMLTSSPPDAETEGGVGKRSAISQPARAGEDEDAMPRPMPDSLDLHLRRAIAIVGAALCLIGWYRYIS